MGARFLLPVIALIAALGAVGATYDRDVQPILQRACVACHSPGQVGPMSLTTYESTRPWAPRIKAVVTRKTMPPGVAERHYGLFGDDGALHQHDIDLIVQWVDAGAPEK